MVTAEYVPATSLVGGTFIGTLNDKQPLLMEWNSHLYVVYGVIYSTIYSPELSLIHIFRRQQRYRSPCGRTDSFRDRDPCLRARAVERTARASRCSRVRRRDRADAGPHGARHPNVRTLQSGSTLARHSAPGSRAISLHVTVACSSRGICYGNLRFSLAMDRELVPQRHLYVGSNMGPKSMAVALFCHFRLASARFRADSAGCAKNATSELVT